MLVHIVPCYIPQAVCVGAVFKPCNNPDLLDPFGHHVFCHVVVPQLPTHVQLNGPIRNVRLLKRISLKGWVVAHSSRCDLMRVGVQDVRATCLLPYQDTEEEGMGSWQETGILDCFEDDECFAACKGIGNRRRAFPPCLDGSRTQPCLQGISL